MIILGIETSCDETAAAICKEGEILSSTVRQQIIHSDYGGVIPEIASREHEYLLNKVVNHTLYQSGVKLNELDAISVTQGPGLAGTLLTGVGFAKGLGLGLGIPIIPINHLEGHILAPGIENRSLKPPYLCLLVSGGHTQIIDCDDYGQYSILGETIDDACGEAFDKVGKLLNLEYPGGPKVAQLAKSGNSERFNFPRALTQKRNLDFSFSGLKTAVLYELENLNVTDYADVAASFQAAVIDVLVKKLSWALGTKDYTKLICSGGVAANEMLRIKLDQLAENTKVQVYYPSLELCTDNAAMIAMSGFFLEKEGIFSDLSVSAKARLRM